MPSLEGFVGAMVVGRMLETGLFKINDVLGSAFIVDSEHGIALTNHHVLPSSTSKDQLGFLMSLPPNKAEYIFHIDASRIVRWDGHDVVAFRVRTLQGTVPPHLATFPFHLLPLAMGDQVIVAGIPKDHNLHVDKNELTGTLRALTGFVVTQYDEDVEASFPVIRGMSGGPVVHNRPGGLFIVGILYDYRVYAVERLRSETTEETKDGQTKRQVYEADEVLRFGAFYDSRALGAWLNQEKEGLARP